MQICTFYKSIESTVYFVPTNIKLTLFETTSPFMNDITERQLIILQQIKIINNRVRLRHIF